MFRVGCKGIQAEFKIVTLKPFLISRPTQDPMASAIETFETMLKEVVTSKRLSTSKMSSLSEHALKYMKMDTQLVSTLFLTHKALPSSNKVNSLYVFDALARAAKHQVTKRKLTLPTEPDKGNPVTFLLKMEGVLDGLFKDLLAVTDVPEMKEKMKKVLDIWSKAGTFSTDVLTRLSDLAKESEQDQVANRAQTSVTDPRRPTKSPVNGTVDSSTPPIAPPTGASASLPTGVACTP
ncbi:hypothetical protein BS47DRAFT_1043107 [Hydnum rufescens UP504]|uniref:CID domain-containing protein n=1 Tax=Hydnum rufescens UP504 TaxID=1448309 RepID=A0A9P6AVZ9_9AGAM|nr:hypothetical protein BS47DRAFT_1043107 [Hydnum rufescens UP504]